MSSQQGEMTEWPDRVCLGCGCLCDDVTARVHEGRIVEVDRACAMGDAWFRAIHDDAAWPDARIEGRAVPLDEALERAASMLSESRMPMFAGLDAMTNAGIAEALTLAERLRAAVDGVGSFEATARVMASFRLGGRSASWGELLSRADLIVFWNVDLMRSHPRFWERFVEPPGRFAREGRSGRTVVAVAGAPNSVFELADLAIQIDVERQAEALGALHGLVMGRTLDLARLEQGTGIAPGDLGTLADRLRGSRYGAIVVGTGLLTPGPAYSTVEALNRLVEFLNEQSRFSSIWLGEPGNGAGLESILTRRLGAPMPVQFVDGRPAFEPHGGELEKRLQNGEIDLLVDFGSRDVEATVGRSDVPRIRIAPGATSPDSEPATVAIGTSMPGKSAGGAMVRADEITLKLEPYLSRERAVVETVLRQLLARCTKPGS